MKPIILIFLACCTLPLWAQVQTEEELSLETLQNQKLLMQETQSTAYILQAGNSNQAVLNVKNQQVVQVIQEGNLNLLNLDMAGTENQATVLQRGSQNEYKLNLEGTDNQLTVLQEGADNKVTQSLENAEALDIELLQFGTGHELIHQGIGLPTSPIQVIQQGNPMKVIIEKKDF